MRELSQGTFAHNFVGSTVVGSYGLGECGECAIALATQLIHKGLGNLAFVVAEFSHHLGPFSETGHQFIVANMPDMPAGFHPDMTVEAFLNFLPKTALILDPFLELLFPPHDGSPEFTRYFNVYGVDAKIRQCIHLRNFKARHLALYFDAAKRIRETLDRENIFAEYKTYGLPDKIAIHPTSIINLLNEKTTLGFFGVRDSAYKVDAVAKIAPTQEKAAMELQKRLKGYGHFFTVDDSQRLFVLEGVNLPGGDPSIAQRVQTALTQR